MTGNLKPRVLTLDQDVAPSAPASGYTVYVTTSGVVRAIFANGQDIALGGLQVESEDGVLSSNVPKVTLPRGSLINPATNEAKWELMRDIEAVNTMGFAAYGASGLRFLHQPNTALTGTYVTGTVAASNDTDTAYCQITSGAVIGDRALIQMYPVPNMKENQSIDFIIRTGAAIANESIFCQMAEGNSGIPGFAAASLSSEGYGFVYQAGTDTTWQGFIKTGGVVTKVNTGVTVAVSTSYRLRARVRASSVAFEVNDGGEVLINSMPWGTPNTAAGGILTAALYSNSALAKIWKIARGTVYTP